MADDSWPDRPPPGPFYSKHTFRGLIIGEEVTLLACPPGPILYEGVICWRVNARSEHGVAAYKPGGAFIVKKTVEEQEKTLVRPVQLCSGKPPRGDAPLHKLLSEIVDLTTAHTADPVGMAKIFGLACDAIALIQNTKEQP